MTDDQQEWIIAILVSDLIDSRDQEQDDAA